MDNGSRYDERSAADLSKASAADRSKASAADRFKAAIIPEFVTAPAFGDPEYFLHEDAVPVRDALEAAVDAIRAASGLPPISASMFRQRTAKKHLRLAVGYFRPYCEAKGAGDDKLCRGVQAALDTEVEGICAYCGCSFAVVAVVPDPVAAGKRCGRCYQPFRDHLAVLKERAHAPNDKEKKEERGWTPW